MHEILPEYKFPLVFPFSYFSSIIHSYSIHSLDKKPPLQTHKVHHDFKEVSLPSPVYKL